MTEISLTAGERDQLLYRRQFVMGPDTTGAPAPWVRTAVRPTLEVAAHPDLPVTQAAQGPRSVTLIGYLLDPLRPSAGDEEIVNDLLAAVDPHRPFEHFLTQVSPLGGRWVLIVDDGDRVRLFTDPCGYRQVVYTLPDGSGAVWSGSQPGLIAERLGLTPDAEAMDFLSAYEQKRGRGWPGHEYFWPGDTSPYREIKRLVPNHFLDLATGQTHRFWPSGTLKRRRVADGVDETSRILRGLVAAAARRYDLSLSITAGRDTRVLLAASREASANLMFFTLTDFWNETAGSPDVQIPAILLSRLGLPHTVIHCEPVMSSGFAQVYKQNVTTAHAAYGTMAEALYRYYPDGRLCMKGNAIPIARARYTLQGHSRNDATPEALARSFGVEGHPFAIRAFGEWLRDAQTTQGIPIMDLFYWEQIEGSWQAMAQLEWDIAQEVFVPYNCRTLLATGLAVDERYRRPPQYAFFQKLIQAMWPDVLQEPINPHDPHQERVTVRSRIRALLIRTNLYRLVPDRLKRHKRHRQAGAEAR